VGCATREKKRKEKKGCYQPAKLFERLLEDFTTLDLQLNVFCPQRPFITPNCSRISYLWPIRRIGDFTLNEGEIVLTITTTSDFAHDQQEGCSYQLDARTEDGNNYLGCLQEQGVDLQGKFCPDESCLS